MAGVNAAPISVAATGSELLPAVLACGVAFLACELLARRAPRLGWLDVPGGDGGRKLQPEPVPPVGGAAILAGWLAAAAVAVVLAGALPGGARALLPAEHPLLAGAGAGATRAGAALALGAAFLVGTLDDLRRGGLGPGAKLAGQLLAGACLALPAWLVAGAGAAPGPASILLCALAGAVALNALNTFDNADGAAPGVSALGLLAAGAPIPGAAVLGILPANLLRGGRAGGAPRAYLGDGGSHLLGMALLVVPGAWPALGLPLLDLARVALERLRAGIAPWRGDRRHLAHRLARLGLGPRATAGLLWAAASPPLFLGGPWGWSLLALAFALLVVWSAPAGGDACGSSAGSR